MQGTIECVGCDLGDRFSDVCLLSATGAVLERRRIRTTQVGFERFFGQRPATRVVIEVCTHSRWVAALLGQLGHQVVVANPRQVKLISASYRKDDRRDAELLARLGRMDPKLLAPVEHRGETQQAHLAIAKARDVLVRCRTMLINSVRGTCKSFGVRLPCANASGFAKTQDAVPDVLRPALDPLYASLKELSVQIRAQDRQIVALARADVGARTVAQVDGVGPLTALVFVLTLEDPQRFDRSRMAAAYLGLSPRRDQSGQRDKQLGITKAGDPFLRRLLVLSANYILGPWGKDSDLRRWGFRLAERSGKNARQRAKVAVARKLAVLMHRLWLTGAVYEPLGYRRADAQAA